MSILSELYSWNEEQQCWMNDYGEREQKTEKKVEETVQAKLPFIRNETQIENLQSINGLSIEEIERRAKPRGYSMCGFMGANESFKEVLKADWATVKMLGVTHAELAAHLKNIIDLAYKAPNRKPFELIELQYRTSDMEGNTIISEGFQNLQVALASTRGWQGDLFEPIGNSPKEVDTPTQWNDDNTIINASNGVTLVITTGVLSYIREFGFYEGGGEANPYRVDPKKIMALLTGGDSKGH